MQTVLVINSGSSSLKCTLFHTGHLQETAIYRIKLGNILNDARVKITNAVGDECLAEQPDFSSTPQEERHHIALEYVLTWLKRHAPEYKITAFGHRIVHGGKLCLAPKLLDDQTLDYLESLIPLAPLHQPYNLMLVDCCHNLAPDLPQIACFDTMFHSTQSDLERHYAIPRKYTDAGIQRYGFHGLSYEFIAHRLQQEQNKDVEKTIVCHLGAGSSMCAIKNGKSIASSMGFTAVDGLPMGSRCGNIDPGVLLYLQREYGLNCDSIEHLIYKESGWLGVSGESADMLTLKRSTSPHAQEAIAMFAYRIALEVGRLSAALNGLDQLVFTGGVGENDAELRHDIMERCSWLGVRTDTTRNKENATLISSDSSQVIVRVIPTDEEAMIAHHVTEVIGF